MQSLVQSAFYMVLVALLLLPAALIVSAVAKLRRAPGSRWWTLVGGAALVLSLVSLDVVVTLLVARAGSPDLLARYSLFSAYTSDALSFVALLMVGIGLHGVARDTS